MAGPSAIGSVKGSPSSMISAPPATSASSTSPVRAGVGSPPVTNVTSAARPSARHLAKRVERRSGELTRSEEHTSELQSLMRISYAVFCLKKKTHNNKHTHTHNNIN